MQIAPLPRRERQHADGGRANIWDSQNRLTSCTYNGQTSAFTYGADGLRRSMATGGVITDFLLDGQNVVREIRGGSPVATYVIGLRGPEYRQDETVTDPDDLDCTDPFNPRQRHRARWYLYDGLGGVTGEVDACGRVTATRKYDVYGSVRSTTGEGTTSHKFVGSLGHTSEDDTGAIYMRARYYDPAIGRFISEDPGRNGANWCAYCSNNPVNLVDPDGLSWTKYIPYLAVGLVAVILGGLGAVTGCVPLMVAGGVLMLGDLIVGIISLRPAAENTANSVRSNMRKSAPEENPDQYYEKTKRLKSQGQSLTGAVLAIIGSNIELGYYMDLAMW